VGTEKRERQKANRALKYEEQVKFDRRSKLKRNLVRGGIVVVLAAIGVVGIMIVSQSGDDDGDATTEPSAAPTAVPGTGTGSGPPTEETLADFQVGTGECAPATKPAERPTTFEDAPRLCIDPAATHTATFDTTEGTIVVELDSLTAPGTVNNFVNLARWGYYDGTPIFRAAPSIGIIQGGGMSNADSVGYTIPDEGSGYSYTPGVLAMARTGEPNSAGGQWFFGVDDAVSALDNQGTYVVFGKVSEGLDVAETILGLAGGGDDGQTPTRDVTLNSVTIATDR
jgi:cyclophilin family peptidyl-prolyl cis-trans isomerase